MTIFLKVGIFFQLHLKFILIVHRFSLVFNVHRYYKEKEPQGFNVQMIFLHLSGLIQLVHGIRLELLPPVNTLNILQSLSASYLTGKCTAMAIYQPRVNFNSDMN